MNKYIFIIHLPIFLIITTMFISYKIDLSLKFSDFLSFLSIAIGFCITSLSLIATTKFSKYLYEKQSKNRNDRTLLHELVKKFQDANNYFLFSIAMIVGFIFLQEIPAPYEYFLTFKYIGQAVIMHSIFFGLYNFWKLIKEFGNYVIQASKKQ